MDRNNRRNGLYLVFRQFDKRPPQCYVELQKAKRSVHRVTPSGNRDFTGLNCFDRLRPPLAINLELGVIIRDPDVAHRIDRHFRSLMHPDLGILQRIIT